MSKICGYSCEHNKSGVCQISVCDKKSIISDKTEIQTLRLDELDYTIIPNSDIKPLLDRLQQENKILNGAIQTYEILLKANVEENKQLQERIEYLERSNNRREDTILGQRQEISDLEDKYKELDKMCELYSKSLYNAELSQYKDNWNKLKEWASNFYNSEEVGWAGCGMRYTLEKILELEQGSDSNEL